MAENIGGIEMEFGLNSRGLEKQLQTIGGELNKISKGGEEAQQAFSVLYDKIRDLGRASKDVNGKKIPGVLSASEANSAISYIDKIARKYDSLYKSFMEAGNSKFGPRLNLNDAFRDLERLERSLARFYNQDGQPSNGLGILLKGVNFGEIKQQMDVILRSATESEKGISSQIKSLIAQEREYIKYSNLAQAAIRRIEDISKQADASLKKSVDRFGANDPRVKALESKIAEFRAVKQGWENLRRQADREGIFPESTYRNYYQEHRDKASALYQAGVDLNLRNFESTNWLSAIQRIMSQNDKLYDSYRKIEEAKEKLSASKGVASESEKRSIDEQIRKLNEYKAKLQTIEDTKLGSRLAFRDQSNHSIVGADFRNLIAESNNLSASIKKGHSDSIALEKQLDVLTAKEREVISIINSLKQAQSEGFARGLNSANSKEMENIFNNIKKMENALAEIRKYHAGAEIPATAFGKVFTQNINDARKSVKELNDSIKRTAKEESDAISKAQNLAVAQQKVKDAISEVERKMEAISGVSAKEGVSQSTLSSLDDWKRKLELIIEDYKTLMSDASMISNKGVVASVVSDKKNAFTNIDALISRANVESKAYTSDKFKNLSDLEKAKEQLRDYIRRLNTEYEKTGAKSFHPDTDTTRYEKAREAIKSLIDKYSEWLSLLNSGKSLKDVGFTVSGVRGEKKDALAEMNVARTVTNELNKQAVAADRAAGSSRNKAQADRESAIALENLIKKYHQLSSASKGASSAIGELKNLAMSFAPVYGLQQTVMSIIEIGGEIEKQHVALQTILGDVQDANILFEDLKGLALQSPFTFGELTKDVKQLAAYNVEYNDLYNTAKRLADISSGLGVSFERIGLAYGQVKSRSWLDAKELRQFAYAGVPLLQSLADMYSKTQEKSVSKAQVRKMITNREVSFEDVQKVLWEMTDEGGKFYNMQLVLSETLLGRYNKLKDAWEIMLSGFAKGDSVVGGALKGILNFFTEILLHVNTVIPLLTSFFSMFVARKVAKLGSLAVERGITRQNQLQAMSEVKKAQAEGVVNSEKVKELILTRQITVSEAKRLGLIDAQTAATMRLGFTMKGITAIAHGMWTAIGGWIGVAIATVTYFFTYFRTKSSEIEQSINQASDELKDKGKQIGDFKESRLHIDTSDVDKAKKAIRDYVDFIKENAPYMSNEVISDITKTDDVNKKLEKAKEWVETIQKGNKIALEYSKKIVENAKDYFESKGKKYEAYYNDAPAVLQKGANADLFAKIAYNDISKSLGNLSDKVKSSPEVRYAYKAIRESLEEGMNEEFKNAVNMRIDKLFGIDISKDAEHDVVSGLMHQLENIGSDVDDKTREIMQTVANRIRYGEELTDAEKELVRKLMNKTGDDIKEKYPVDVESVIKNLLSGSNFVANIRLHIDDEDVNDLAEALRHMNDKPGFTSKLEQFTKGRTLPEAQKAVDDALKKVNDDIKATSRNTEMNALGKLERLRELEKEQKELEDLQKRVGKPIKENNKNGSKKDIQLENLKKRIQAAEKFIKLYKEYVKMYGDVVAKKRIADDTKGLGFGGFDFSDVVGVREKLLSEAQKLLNADPKSEQRKALRDTNKEKKQEEILNREKETLEGISNAYSEINSRIKEMYQLRDSISSKYGKGVANTIAGSISYYDKNGEPVVMGLGNSYSETLRKQIENALKKIGMDKKYTVDSLLGMDSDELENAIGKGIVGDTSISTAIKSLKDEEARIQKESADAVVSILEMDKSVPAEISRIQNELEDRIRKIKNSNKLSQEEKDAYIKKAETDAKERITELSADYFAIFNSNWIATEGVINKITKTINKSFDEGIIKADEYSKKILELDKARQMYNQHGLFGNSDDTSVFMKEGLNGLISKYSDMFTYATSESKEAETTEEKKRWEKLAGTYKEMYGNLTSLSNKINNASDAFSLLTGAFDGLAQVADSLSEMFSALGYENTANRWSDTSDSIKAVSSVLSPVNNILGSAMSGNVSGIISNAISAPVQMIAGPIIGFAKLHDKKLQRQIDVAIYNQKLLQNISSNLQKSLEKSLGGLYTNKVDKATIDDLNLRAEKKRVKYGPRTFAIQTNSDATLKQVQKAEKSRNYYDAMKASLMLQKDEASYKLKKEQDKKNSDSSTIEDYKQEIKELDDQIKGLAEEMANALYGIDFKSWANTFANAIVNAWASGTNAVKAYKDAVADVVRNSAMSVIQQKIIETALKPIQDEFLSYFDKNGGILDNTGIDILNKLFNAAEDATDKSLSIMDEAEKIAQKHGYTLKNKSTGLSPAIAGVTEDTADLLGSYINSIRAYCALNNSYMTKLSEEQIPYISTTLSSQLAQLRQVQENTRITANASSELRDMIYNTVLGINPMYVKITQ